MEHIKEIDIKNQTYYFFDNIINIKDSDPNLLKIDKTIRKYWYLLHWLHKSLNPLYLIVSEADGYMKEKNGSKYLIFNSANKNNEVLKKYNEL